MRILITGGTGSLGTQLCKAFHAEGHFVTVVSRNPHTQALLLAQPYAPQKVILADVCNPEAMLDACAEQDVVIHAAALKRVERGDSDAREYYRVNVNGTLNVAMACRKQGVISALFISSDKACEPCTTYGITKAIAERLWLAEQNQPVATNPTHFACLRYGNVVESNGSVWHLWRNEKMYKRHLVVREPEPTRFFLSLADAVTLVKLSLLYMRGGEIFVPAQVPGFNLWDLAKEIEADTTKWQTLPLLPTEKQHEVLVAPTEYAEPVEQTDAMWRILLNRTKDLQVTPSNFSSATAKRLSGAEVIARLLASNK